jgi:hypothetical protein
MHDEVDAVPKNRHSETSDDAPRVCVCVLMNHPFVGNLPLLRRLYAGRFSTLLFLVPFERVPDEDVITVYRGSYCHAGYITDAREALLRVDCDYFIMVHDDVLLNPALDERSFRRYFPLGRDDGFFPSAESLSNTAIGDWTWLFGFVPKLLYPRSQLFGSGVEAANIRKYLPAASVVEGKLRAAGKTSSTRVRISMREHDDVSGLASDVLLYGLGAPLDRSSPLQNQVDAHSLAAHRGLIDAMAAAIRAERANGRRPLDDGADDSLQLPIPLVCGGFMADFYIVPKTRLADYAHYIGVASAANLFVEIMAPTLLYAVCERVWSAAEFALDFKGFQGQRELQSFEAPAFMAIHPFKFSLLRDPAQQERFLATMQRLRSGLSAEQAVAPGEYSLGFGTFDELNLTGWHPSENWGGRWMDGPVASLAFRIDPDISPEGFNLTLRAPLHPDMREFTGSLKLNGDELVKIHRTYPDDEFEIRVTGASFARGEVNRIELIADTPVQPCKLDPNTRDERSLGFGASCLTFF